MRLKRGPISVSRLRRLLGDEFAWYREKCKKDESFFTKVKELVFAFDGERTLIEAYTLVVAAHEPWDPEDVSKWLAT